MQGRLRKFRQRLKLSGLSITGVSATRGRFQLGGVPGAFSNHARARPWGDRRKLPSPPRSARGRQLSGALLPPPPPLLSARRLASRVRQVATALGRFQLGGVPGAFGNHARARRANRAAARRV